MKKIGLRTIKTAICVFCCLLVFIILKLFELIDGVPDDFAFSWYNPFFAAIATAYSVHSSKSASLNQAKNRCVASLIGGVIGILLISIYELFGGRWPNSQAVSLHSFNFLIPYILISLFTILVIVIGVSLNQQQAVFVSILTFLSVTVNPNINVGYWQWQFGLNRILSTIIGVLIALGINLFRLPHRYNNKNLLFCVGIDGMLLADNDRFKGFMQYKMNYLNRIGANVTLFTTRTPTTFMPLLNDVKINNPVICMSGACLYDAANKKYLAYENIDEDISLRVLNIIRNNSITPFINVIRDDILYIYNESLDNEGEIIYANSKRNAPYCNYINTKYEGEALYYLIIEKEEIINKLIDDINNSDISSRVLILAYDVREENQKENLKYIKIYNKNILNLNILNKYIQNNKYELVGLTSDSQSNHLLINSKYCVTLDKLKIDNKCYIKTVDDSKPDNLFKEVQRLYHYNLAKYRNDK